MTTLADFKGQYKGRVFLFGSGASLRLLTPEQKALLGQEYTFAGARFFKWQEAGFTPSFYILSEDAQAMEWRERGFSNASATIAKFWVEWQPEPGGWVPIPRPPSLSFHHYTLPESRLSPFEGECRHIHMGNDVPIAMLQVARYLGFSEYYLLGVDQTAAGYVWDLKERRKVGDRYGTMAPMYAKARRELGDRLYDCTEGGLINQCGALPYVPIEEVLARKEITA